jgi:carbonic anhydrase/acetyltransferase-like protein (isoleucine patch superfamily)
LHATGRFPYGAAMIRSFQGITPTVPKSCFIEHTGIVIGDVVMGEQCSVWFHAVIRGDVNKISACCMSLTIPIR